MKNRYRLGTIMALAGGICWGFSGCCCRLRRGRRLGLDKREMPVYNGDNFMNWR